MYYTFPAFAKVAAGGRKPLALTFYWKSLMLHLECLLKNYKFKTALWPKPFSRGGGAPSNGG